MITSLNEKTFQFRGLSTDKKPTENIENGSFFIEMDTSTVYSFDKETKTWGEIDLFPGGGGGDTKLQDEKTCNPTTLLQIVKPDTGYDGLKQVKVTAVNPADYYKPEVEANVTPTTSSQTITPDAGKVFNVVNVEAVDPSQYYKPETSANVSATTSSQTVYPEAGEVFNVVNVSAVTASIDANIQASNIVSGVSILGVNGTYTVPIQASKTVTPTRSQQTINPDSGYSALKKVVVKAAPLSYRSVTPSTAGFYVNPTGSYIGFSSIYVQGVNTGYRYITPCSAQYPGQSDEYYASSDGYIGYSYVTVNRVDSSIDPNITASNIKSGVSILGVTGTLSGGGIIEVNALPASGDPDSIYRLTTTNTDYVYRDNQWYNLNELGIIEVDELPQSGRNDRIYDTVQTSFTTSSTTLPIELAGCGCATVGDYIYVFGGRTSGQAGVTPNETIYKYDSTNDTFTTISGYTYQSMDDSICVVYNNLIYIFSIGSSDYYIFDTTTNTLSLSYMLGSIVRAVSIKGDIVYVTESSQVREYSINPLNNELSPTGRSARLDFSFEIYGGSAVIKDNYLYIMAIRNSYSEGTDFIYKINLDTDFSDNPATAPTVHPVEHALPMTIEYSAVVLKNNTIYLFGGITRNQSTMTNEQTNKILEFDTLTGTCNESAFTLPNAVYSSFSAIVNNIIYVFGGLSRDEMSYTSTVVDTICILSSSVLGEYVYRNNSWLELGGSSGGISVDAVSNLTANGTILSWTAPDTTEIAQYNPQLSYAISIDGTTVATTTQTTFDVAQYATSSSNTVAVTVVLTYTDTKNRTITISGGISLVEIGSTLIDDSNDIYYGTGIKGIAHSASYSYGSDSFPVYTIFGTRIGSMMSGGAYNLSLSGLSSVSNISADMPSPQMITKLTSEYAFTDTTVYSWYYSMMDNSIYASNLGFTFNSYTYYMGVGSKETYPNAVYLFGGRSMDSLVSSIYKLGISMATGSLSFTLLPESLPQAVAFPEVITTYSLISTSGSFASTVANMYILGGYSYMSPDPSGISYNSAIYKFDTSTDVIDSSFSRVIPSNIQVPLGYEADSNMNTHVVNIQGTQYVLGKDTADNKLKLFEFDETAENLKSSGFELTNQNIKAIDTFKTTVTNIPYGLGIYMAEDSDHLDHLYYEKLIKSKLTPTVLYNDILSGQSSMYFGDDCLTFIKNNHMYYLASMGDSYDFDLANQTTTTLSLSGDLASIDPGMMLVQTDTKIYLLGGSSSAKIYEISISNSTLNATRVGDITSDYCFCNGTALEYNGYIYIFGGAYKAYTSSDSYSASNLIYKFDPTTNKCNVVAEMQDSIINAIGIVHNNYAYILGGIDQYNTTSSKILKFDFSTDTIVNSKYCLFSCFNTNWYNSARLVNNQCYYINNDIYIKIQPYCQPVHLLKFDTTLEDFVDASSSEFLATKQMANDAIILNTTSDYLTDMVGNNSEIYAIEFYRETFESPTKYRIVKHSK